MIVKTLLAGVVLVTAYQFATFAGISDTRAGTGDVIPAAKVEPACSPRNFVVKNIKMRREYDNIMFTASVVNSSAVACGIQLKASTYDKYDSVLDTSDFWPASIRNIEPGATEDFKAHLRYDKTATNYQIVPIAARVWVKR